MSELAEKVKNTELKGDAKTLVDMVNDMEAEFARALPLATSAKRFVRIALTTLRTNPKLMTCTAQSVLGGLMQAAQLGLEISDVLGEAFLVPRTNRRLGTVEATFQLGYRGLINLAGRSGVTVDPHEVYAPDEFDFRYGTEAYLHHTPVLDRQGDVTAFYAVALFPGDRQPQFTVMSARQMEEHRDKFASDSRDNSPWHTNYVAMARKTVVRRLLTYLPMAPEASTGLAADAHVVTASPVTPHDLDIVEVLDET